MNANWQQLKELFHAAVELPPHDREAFLKANCAADDELHCKVSALLTAHESAGDFISQPALVDVGFVASDEQTDSPSTVSGQQIGSYQVISELGRGGMGSVYLAARADKSFDKQVALKLIKRGMDSDAIIKRFVMERQILANLDHPNIARLIDGGTTEDGLPYFVLEYIEGTTITRYCDQHKLNTIERLKLFRQVCAAVQFAHQNLIVHRDLKPSNIIVTEDGTPKLLDFGIAKLLSAEWSSSIEATATIGRVLTPEYASPEQLRGLPVTTSSDVYSLGVVLYELLSGHRPFNFESRSPEEVARMITASEPIKPSVVITRIEGARHTDDTEHVSLTPEAVSRTRDGNVEKLRRRLAGDLDNILLKALRKEPERRYASVQEFSEDLRRHLEGLPVLARPDTLSYRTSKFITRHKAGVAAAVIVMLTLLSATVITSWQARVARQERAKAEARFNQVRKLANAVLFEYHDGIEKLPGSTPIREKMVRDALEYLDNLSAESSGDAPLQSELASAYEKVGNVQGAPYTANLGNYKGALASHKKALAIREKLNTSLPQNAQLKLDLARSYGAVGELSQVTGNIPAALENYRKAFNTLGSPESGETRRELSILHVRFAKALVASGELAKALESVKEGIAIANELALASPNEPKLKRALAYAYIVLGDALEVSGDLKEALVAQRTAFALLEPLTSATNAQSRRDVNLAYARIADTLAKMGDKRGALEIELKALAIDAELARADPSNALERRDLYIDYYKIAFMQEALGDMKSALTNQRTCIALCEAVVADNPASSESRGDLAVAYFRAGEMFENSGKPSEALENYQKALAIKEAMLKADPTNAVTRGDISEDYLKVGDASLKLGYPANALEAYRNSLTIREELVATNPEDAEGRIQLARIYENLGAYSLLLANKNKRADDWQEARRRYQQSADVWVDLKSKGKLSADYAHKPDEVSHKLAACNSALNGMSAATGSSPKGK